MPTTLLAKNGQRQWYGERATIPLRSLEPNRASGRNSMMATPAFCQYPGDLDGCRRSLVRALREDSLSKHCIIEGLRTDWDQCRQILLEGLYDKASKRKGSDWRVPEKAVQEKDLEEACKQVVLFGYPKEIRAVHEIFYQAYYQLACFIICKNGITVQSQPSTDDIAQNVFVSLHKHLLKGNPINKRFATYVGRAVINECIKAVHSKKVYTNLVDEGRIQQEGSSSTVLSSFGIVESWEHFDKRLLGSDQDNLINRIIVALQVLEGSNTIQKYSALDIMANWKLLSQMPSSNAMNLHSKAAIEAGRNPSQSLVFLAADMINANLVEPYQIAIVFAAGTNLNFKQTQELIEELAGLSAGAIHARICRIRIALRPQEQEEQ